jgi:multicomponent Na+:H+ antiporter subunit C
VNLLLAMAVGVLVSVGVLHVLQRDGVRVVVGLYVLWNAINLLLIAIARQPSGDSGAAGADPVVQALTLTAIVITFGFTAFLLTLVAWLASRRQSIDLADFRESRE